MDSETERALRAIVPLASTSPTQIMDAVVRHTVAVSSSAPYRRRRHAARRHGAYVRLHDLEQSRLYNLQLDVIDLQRQISQLQQLREMLDARVLNSCDAGDGSFVRTAMVYYDFAIYRETPTKTVHLRTAHGRAHSGTSRPGRERSHRAYDGQLLLIAHAVHDRANVPAANGGHDKLVQQLLAKPLEGESAFDFVFDRTSQRVLVPDPSQLAFLFSQAKISEEMFIGDIDAYEAELPASPEAPPASPSSIYSESSVSDTDRVDDCECSESRTPLRSLAMADLLSPECSDIESARVPSVSHA